VVRLRPSDWEDSRLSVLPLGKVEDRVEMGDVLSKTVGEPASGGCTEMAVDLRLELTSGSDVSCCCKPGPAPKKYTKKSNMAKTTNPADRESYSRNDRETDEADDDGQREEKRRLGEAQALSPRARWDQALG
jgi:hypothetical protein